MSTEEAVNLYQWMLREPNFSPDEKRVAANALSQIALNESIDLEAEDSI